jgi:hypothetical protein
MEEGDGAWMARILSHFDDAEIAAVVAEAHLTSPIAVSELNRILRGRRDRILQRYLLRLSSLERPTTKEGRQICLEDRAEAAGLGVAPAPTARLWLDASTAAGVDLVHTASGEICATVPAFGSGQRILDVSTGRPGQRPLRMHVLEGEAPRVVGVDRPDDDGPPSG